MNIYSHAEANTRKTWLYLLGFFLFVIGAGWLMSYVLGSQIILWIAVVLSIVMSFGSFWYSDKLVLSLSHAKPIEKKDAPELYRIVENLSITAGLPIPRIFIIKDQQPNAFATGRDAKHAVVAVTTGLLQRLDRVELEGVVAHELSHIGNRDILVGTVAVVLVGFISILADIFLRSMIFGGGRRGGDRGSAGGVIFLVGIGLSILAPIAATLMRLAISRKREFL
ncbi:M48 family metalloprotease, partial [Patescibacteria group bacterium]|nr:M48 family metalloprotease [Patescibacteria group bacterium]